MATLLLFGIIAAIIFIGIAFSWRQQAKEYETFRRQHGAIETQRRELEASRASHQAEMERKNAELIGKQSALIALAKQKSAGFPYLADAWAEFLALRDKAAENHLRYKSHPAAKAAITIRQFASERREAIRAAKVSEYKLKLYEALFPWITQFTEEGIEDSYIRIGSEGAEDTKDPATKRLSEGEYRSLSTTETSAR